MDPKSPAPVQLPYAPPPPGATRGQFRVLLLLTFINTVLLGTYVIGPGLTTFARQQWADYHQHRAQRAADAAAAAVRAAFLPAQQQCMDHLYPAGTLLYAEDRSGVAQLTAAGPVNHVYGLTLGVEARPSQLAILPVGATHPPCTAGMPADLDVMHDTSVTILYLHRCTTVGGERLVVVHVSGKEEMSINTDGPGGAYNAMIIATRELHALALQPGTLTADAAVLSDERSKLKVGSILVTVDSRAGVTADRTGQLRLFAGQPDPTDPARFHIPYAIDGVGGTIDGRLTPDDVVRLVPDGRLAALEDTAEAHPPKPPSIEERRATGKPW
jgi:hypothetical protein